MACIILHGAANKACRVLKARLEPLGHQVYCSHLPLAAAEMHAEKRGCILVTSARCSKCVVIDHSVVYRNSSRDLATRIIKTVFRS